MHRIDVIDDGACPGRVIQPWSVQAALQRRLYFTLSFVDMMAAGSSQLSIILNIAQVDSGDRLDRLVAIWT